MIPGPWVFVLLGLASWRLWRLLAQDDLPPLLSLRNRVVGAVWSPAANAWLFDRPVLAHFLQCSYCAGFWITLGWWLTWSAEPHWTLVAAAPFALSAMVGLVAQRLG